MIPLCGEPLRSVMWQARACAKPAGHRGKHLSAAAIRAARQRAATQPPTGSPLVAAVIRQARDRAAWSRPRLAAVVGVSATAVQHWEQGKRTPSAASWVQLELALGPLGVVRDRAPEPGEADDAAA